LTITTFRDTERYLPYGIIQYYLPSDTNNSVLDLFTPKRWEAELAFKLLQIRQPTKYFTIRWLGGLTDRTLDRDLGSDYQSGRCQVVTTWKGKCLRTGKPCLYAGA